MNKTSSIIVAIIIIVFLVGIAYLAGRRSIDGRSQLIDSAVTAPDGTELNGPKNPPVLGNQDRNGDPRLQSKGPNTPPPGGGF